MSEPDIKLLCYGDSPSQGLYWFDQRVRLGSDAAVIGSRPSTAEREF